jgi:hypothetical protein
LPACPWEANCSVTTCLRLVSELVLQAAPAGRNQTEGPAGEVIQAEHALREALLAGYDQQDFPSAAYGRANVSINLYAHKILQVSQYSIGYVQS